MNDDPCYRSAGESIRAFRAGECSPVDLMRAVLDRAERLAPALNATTAIHADAALAAARAAEARYRAGTARPLEGIPVAIKEETSVAGWRKTIGSFLWDEVPTAHHPMVDKLIAAGAIPHLQTTVPEFCLIGQTLSRRFGVTRNPWNPAITPGGSSGGSGVALAAGMAPLATGSDMAGSIRIPAAMCGVYGFKPPFGRLASAPGEELFAFAVEGPMARTVLDLARMQNVIAGPHPSTYSGMPYVPLPEDPAPIAGVRLGLSFTTGHTTLCPDTRRNLERACAALERAGAVIEPVDLVWDGGALAEALIEAIFGIFLDEYLAKLPAERLGEGTPYLRWLMERHCGKRNSITRAAALAGSFVDPAVVAERFARLKDVVDRSALRRHEARVGRIEEVLVEGPSRRDGARCSGRTRQGKLIHLSDATLREGALVEARVTHGAPHFLLGEVVRTVRAPRHKIRVPLAVS